MRKVVERGSGRRRAPAGPAVRAPARDSPSQRADGLSDAPQYTDWSNLIAVKIIQIAEIISRSATQVYEAGYGLRNSELRILLLLGTGETLSVNEISRRAGIDKAWISRSLAVMTKANLVRRIAHPSDSRKSLVGLTEKGLQSLRLITPIALTRDRYILAGLDERRVHEVLDTLRMRAQQLLLPELAQRLPNKRHRRSARARPSGDD